MKTLLVCGLTGCALAAIAVAAAAPTPREPLIVLDGFVTDGSGAGWPLYAKVVAIPTQGGDDKRQHTRLGSGRYQMVTLEPDTEYTLTVTPRLPGYVAQTRTISTGSSGELQEDFQLLVDTAVCNAPGYAIVGGTCQFGGGGLFYGNVYDATTGAGLNGVRVSVSTGDSRLTVTTPEDPHLAGGFYYLFTPDPGPDPDWVDRPILTAAKPGFYNMFEERWPSLNGAKVSNFRLPPPGLTERVSVASDGSGANGESFLPAISADGRFVAFDSFATNLVPGDTTINRDVFVHDRQTGETTRVSISSDGEQANGDSAGAAISVDGRFVAFVSFATNLVPGDSNSQGDIFVHDRQTGETTRVSVDSGGNEANGGSVSIPALSADGRFVAFDSRATNLVPGDIRGRNDIFVHDRQTGETTRVSVASDGSEAGLGSDSPALSADGRFVTFNSSATNLVPGDTNGHPDVFVRDRQAGETARVSVDSSGGQGNNRSGAEAAPLSADGRFVAFISQATNLVPDDLNNRLDVFVHDRQTGETSRVSVTSDGHQASGHSFHPTLSADGRFVAFDSQARNLVPGDTNSVLSGDVFVHDRQTGETSRVSVTSDGREANDDSYRPAMSANGEVIAFNSRATNLVPGDGNHQQDIFVHIPPPAPAAAQEESPDDDDE